MLDLRTGETVLDVGCGTGLLAADMALTVGESGRVHGVDPSRDTLAMARRRCADWPWVELLEGTATSLPQADATFDAVVSTQVLEYVPDVDAALAEMHRVLRPGGRALVMDTDWDGLVLHADDMERQARMLQAWRAHGAHHNLPRSLPSRLQRAGLTVTRRELLMLFDTSLNPHCYAGGMAGFVSAFAVKRGGIAKEEAAAWVDDLRSVDARGDFTLVLPRFVFMARKPG
jgi:SAM-dependent methyltransferase